MFTTTLNHTRYAFDDLKAVMAAASPDRSGDRLAGVAAGSAAERVAARYVLADLPLGTFLSELVIPYEADEVSWLIVDGHDAAAFAPIAHMTVGAWRDWLLSEAADARALAALAPGASASTMSNLSR